MCLAHWINYPVGVGRYKKLKGAVEKVPQNYSLSKWG
jgi:hypothetical protein